MSVWSSKVPVWLMMAGNLATLIAFFCIVVMIVPYRLVSKVRLLRKCRGQIVSSMRRMVELTMRGPFFRLIIWCGRRGSCGRLSSQCRQPQALKMSNAGCNELTLGWKPRLPWGNAFHEESYVLASRECRSDPTAEAAWEEIELASDDVVEFKGSYRYYLGELPGTTRFEFRVCARNCWGRSDWSETVRGATLAHPCEGGFTGPLGPAAIGLSGGRKQYRWTQARGEVSFRVPIGEGWTSRDIRFKATTTRVEILHVPKGSAASNAAASGAAAEAPAPESVLLAGAFPKKVKTDDVFWEIEVNELEGRHISVQMAKAEATDKWPCLVEGDAHPHIDVHLLKTFTEGLDGLGGDGGGVLGPGKFNIFGE